MRTYSKILPVAALLGIVGIGSPASAQAFQPMQFEMTAYIKTDNQKRSENSRVWMKAPDKYRLEQSTGAQKLITIANGRDVWQIDELRKFCQHSKEDPNKVLKVGQQAVQGANLLAAFRKKGGKKVGQAKIDGVLCTTYRRKDASGMTYTLWIQPDGRVRRVLSSGTMTGASGIGEPIVTHILESRADIKWLPATNMDETLFRPPAGMTVTEKTPDK